MDRLKKKLLLPDSITAGRWALLRDPDDVEDVAFKSSLGTAEFHALLDDAAGVGLSTTPMTEADIAVAPQLQAVARIGVGYDGADVPALTKRRIPLMITGTANSVAVAEHAVYFMLSLSKHGKEIDLAAREQGWPARYELLPSELYRGFDYFEWPIPANSIELRAIRRGRNSRKWVITGRTRWA